MSRLRVNLVDPENRVMARAEVDLDGDHYGGTIQLRTLPDALLALFLEFEEVVNGQMFVFLDEIQAKINLLGLRAIFDDGLEATIENLQVFPTTGDVTFRLVGQPGQAGLSVRPTTPGSPLTIGTSAPV